MFRMGLFGLREPLVVGGGAILALGLTAILVIPWPAATPEVRLTRFESSLVAVDPRGLLERAGRVHLTPKELVISASPYSEPTVHVVTAEVPLSAVFSVAVVERRGGGDVFPFRAKAWDPGTEAAVEAWYDGSGGIWAGVRLSDRWLEVRRLGTYTIGGENDWKIMWNERVVSFSVSQSGGDASFSVARVSIPNLWAAGKISLTLYATSPGSGAATIAIMDPVFEVPSQKRYGTTTAHGWFKPIIVLGSVLSLLWVIASMRRLKWPSVSSREFGALLLLLALGVGAGWWLSDTPGHPIDSHAASRWSRIAREGPQAIIPVSLLASGVASGATQPYWSFAYSYPPLLTYTFWLVGKIAPVGREIQTVKMLSVVFAAFAAVSLMILLRIARIELRQALLIASFYLLNPAILFDSAVWTQMDSFVAFFLVLAAGGIILRSGPLLWLGMLLAALSKQTGALFVPILLVIALFQLGAGRLIRGLPPAIILTFLLLAPLFLGGMHPAAIYRPLATKMVEFGTISGMETANAVVSQGSFTLWASVSGLDGARGLARLAFPDYVASRFGLPYFTLSRIVFVGFLLLMCVLLYSRRRSWTDGMVFLALAAYGVAVGTLLTRVQPRYLYFGVMFTTISLPWMPNLLGRAAVAALTVTMLAGMWGMLALSSVWYPGVLEAFSPDRSWFNGIFASAGTSDIALTIGGLLNTGALAALLVSLKSDIRVQGRTGVAGMS
jgi:hypothetical protein